MVCYSAGALLDAAQDDIAPGNGGLALSQFVLNYKESLRQQCFDHFWLGGDGTCDPADFCNQDFCEVAHESFFDFPSFEPGVSVSVGGSVASELSITLRGLMGDAGIWPLPAEPEVCANADSNDGETPESTGVGPLGGFVTPTGNDGFDCAADAVRLPAWREPSLVLHVSLECEDPRVVGPRLSERWTTVTFEVPTDGVYSYGVAKVGGTGEGRVRLRPCGRTCSAIAEAPLVADFQLSPVDAYQGTGYVTCVPAGRFTARFALDMDDEGEFVIGFEASAGPVGGSCSN